MYELLTRKKNWMDTKLPRLGCVMLETLIAAGNI